MVYEAFFTSDVTVILKTPSKERTAQRNTAALAGAGQLVSGVHCGCPAKCQASSCLSFLTENLTNFFAATVFINFYDFVVENAVDTELLLLSPLKKTPQTSL